jgi:hypothetical protein
MGDEMLRVLALHEVGHETLTKRKIEGATKGKTQGNRYNRPTLALRASSLSSQESRIAMML